MMSVVTERTFLVTPSSEPQDSSSSNNNKKQRWSENDDDSYLDYYFGSSSKQRIGLVTAFLIGYAIVSVLTNTIPMSTSNNWNLRSLPYSDASSSIAFGEVSNLQVDSHTHAPNNATKTIAIESTEDLEEVEEQHDHDHDWQVPRVQPRCEWVMNRFAERDLGTSPEDLQVRYQIQSVDPNVFYRATAHIFWRDFVDGKWGLGLILNLKDDLDALAIDGDPIDTKSTWTWVTGDQHLSNFGAWRNRHGRVVFGVNDFDEGAIYDFQVDVLRVAVSILNHALTNGLNADQAEDAVKQFAKTYVKTVSSYMDNENALLFELTSDTTSGKLKKFLKKVEKDESAVKQLEKFTHSNKTTGVRSFIKGENGQPHPKTRLAEVSPERLEEIRASFTSTNYGATMMQLGWAVREWNDDFFTILDVAARIGSGVGSFGADRFYVLVKGTDGLLGQDGVDGTAVVLDVKFQPKGAVSNILTPHEKAWYDNIFPNSAARTVQAQRRLTSYTDPYTGWVELQDNDGNLRPFSVRQRSPWKASFDDLDKLVDPEDFNEYMEQIAKATATSHVRGSVAKKPGDFKTVIDTLLGKKKNRKSWQTQVALLASAYHEQVLLDFACFKDYVQTNYPAAVEEVEEEADGTPTPEV